MKKTVDELDGIVAEYAEKTRKIPEAEFSAKPMPHKWSKKEVLGHLIDSGHNNLRRFICGQYESVPPKVIYEQDFWVTVNGYQKVSQREVIEQWRTINARISAVLLGMPKENYSRLCDTGKGEVQLRTLEWLAADYVKHMKHHLNQIIPKSFDVSYP